MLEVSPHFPQKVGSVEQTETLVGLRSRKMAQLADRLRFVSNRFAKTHQRLATSSHPTVRNAGEVPFCYNRQRPATTIPPSSLQPNTHQSNDDFQIGFARRYCHKSLASLVARSGNRYQGTGHDVLCR